MSLAATVFFLFFLFFKGNLTLTIVLVLAVVALWFYLDARRATHKRLESLREKYPDGYKSERISFLEHEDHRILLLDLTYCPTDEAVETLRSYRDLISSQPSNSVLTIIDVTDGQFRLEAVEQMKLVISQVVPILHELPSWEWVPYLQRKRDRWGMLCYTHTLVPGMMQSIS